MAQPLSIEGRTVPEPTYDYEVSRLVLYYRKAMRKILRELRMVDLNSAQQRELQKLLARINNTLKELDSDADEWVKKNVRKAALDGAALALVALDVVDSFDEALKTVKLRGPNREMTRAIVADLQQDLLAVSQNISKRTRTVVRQVVAESMRSNMTAGINGRKTMDRDIVQRLRAQLSSAIDTGIVDAAGRRWKPDVYVDMVVRTKLFEAHREAHTNEGLMRGAEFALISSHSAKDACRFHEGRIVALNPNNKNGYPTIAELKATNQIFHPNCKHHIIVFRSLDRLPDKVRQDAIRKQGIGEKAVATGKRNPAESEL